MSGKLYAIAQFTVHAGKERAFREQAAMVFSAVRDRDPGTFVYEWFISDDGRHCTVIDGYEDSAAVLAHFQNVGALMKPLMQMCDAKIDFLGTPSPELAKFMRLAAGDLKHRFQGML